MSRCKALVFALALVFCATPSFAGTLASDGSALPGWHASTVFVSVPNGTMFGTVDYAVYAPGDFPGAFSGYSPDPTHYVYTMQIFQDGTAPLSVYSHALLNHAENPGTFTGGGVGGDVATNAPGDLIDFDAVTWEFAGIGAGGTSVGLAFSSPFYPTNGFAVVQDDSEFGAVIPVPTPGNNVPEPTTWTLAAIGMIGFAFAAARRRRARCA